MGTESVASVGRTKITHFDNGPAENTKVTDPYAPEEINDLNESTPDVEEAIITDEISAIESDIEFQAQLEKEGVTSEQKVSQVNKELPKGVTTKDTAKRGITVKDLDRDMKRIKDRALNGGQEWNSNFSLKSLTWMQKAGKLVNPSGYKSLLDKSKDFGLDFGDELTEASFSLAIIEGALEASSKTDIFEKYINGTPLEKLFQDFIVKEAIELAAKWGSYTSVKSICQNYTVSNKTRKKCIELLFKGFRIKDENLDEGLFKASRRVVSHFDIIYPNWEKYMVGNNVINGQNDHAPILNGNKDLLTLLTYYSFTDHSSNTGTIPIEQDGVDPRKINIACSMQLAMKIKKESLNSLQKKALPNKPV